MEAAAVVYKYVGNCDVERPVYTGPRFVSSMILTPRSGRLGAPPLRLSPTHPGKPRKLEREPTCCPKMGRALQAITHPLAYSHPVYHVEKG